MTGNSVWLYPSAVIMHQKGQSFSITTLFASTFKHQFAVNLNSCQRGRNIFQPDTDGGVAMVAPWPVDHQRERARDRRATCVVHSRLVGSAFVFVVVCVCVRCGVLFVHIVVTIPGAFYRLCQLCVTFHVHVHIKCCSAGAIYYTTPFIYCK